MQSIRRLIYSLLIIFLSNIQSFGNVRLPTLVSDNMVLQRNTNISIWGWAASGEKVSIQFRGKNYKTTTAFNGKWIISLPAMPHGGPFEMKISGNNELSIKNILIGDVWLCSGQSNMVNPIERVKEKYPEEIPLADFQEIRNFFIPTLADVATVHDDLPPGKWVVTNPSTVLQFGSVSYFFAKKLYQKYRIPIGIINASVGGTPIEAWISEEGLKEFPVNVEQIAKFKDPDYLSNLRQPPGSNRPRVLLEPDKGTSGTKKWYDTTYNASAWRKMMVPGYWTDQGIKDLNGVVWYRKEINVPSSMVGMPAKLYLGRIVDADNVYVNGILSGGITYQYPPRRYELPTGRLIPGKNIIVVRVVNTIGKGGFVPDKPYYLTAGGQSIDLKGEWQYSVGQVFPTLDPLKVIPSFSMQSAPTGLYNTMIAPAINYGLKGMIWYQGESNVDRAVEYRDLLPALINDWRVKWKKPDLPFLYVQLPNFMEVEYSPSESDWAVLRQGQLKALTVPNTAMIVAIDLGEWNDIHPLNKKDVGERLALSAQNLAYGEGIVSSGPLYQSAKIEGKKVSISFSNTGSGLISKDGGELNYFSIAGADGNFVWAKAVIEGDKVVVWNENINQPLVVRYAWANNPDTANLYNKEGLPASPFETEP
jgi:sialate O-acetylesterase